MKAESLVTVLIITRLKERRLEFVCKLTKKLFTATCIRVVSTRIQSESLQLTAGSGSIALQ